jgi:hypothetical protein
MKYLILILIPLFLTACKPDFNEEQEIIVNDGKTEIHIVPKKFMEECGDLVDLKDGSFKELANWSVDAATKYYECKNSHRVLKEFIEQQQEK